MNTHEGHQKLSRKQKETDDEGLFAVKLIEDSKKNREKKIVEKELSALELLKGAEHENIVSGYSQTLNHSNSRIHSTTQVNYFGLLKKDLREEIQRRFDNQRFAGFVFEFVTHGDLHHLMNKIKSGKEKKWEEESIFKVAQ